ncbi:metal-dependent hydrolase [uncultured Hymenobacter sp.]|uniref:metal-dependent hydrolase n=1 Tax=uncultured Hymenobacter sp. TaxID=170016 RepID=UPI0035C9BBAB
MTLTYFGHSCFLANFDGTRVLFDPFISPNGLAKDVNVAAIEADYIFLSHGHYDHVADVEAIGLRTGAELLGMFEVLGYFEAKGLKANLKMNLGGRVQLPFGQVQMVGAAHSSSLPDGSYGGLAAGFVIKTAAGRTLYFAGDTALTYDMKLIGERYGRLDFAILPVGDHFTMGVSDALICADWVGTSKIIGMHFDTFPPLVINHDVAKAEAQAAGKELLLLRVGETITL